MVETIRVLAAHQVVSDAFPREEREEDLWGRAAGLAVDSAMSDFAHGVRQGRRPSVARTVEVAMARFDDAVAEAGAEPDATRRAAALEQAEAVLRAYRNSPIVGLPRPRSRLVVVGGEVGMYAQPDFWDGRSRFFEVKSYRATPDRPELALQLRLFQLAFPGFEATLVAFDRFARPVAVLTSSVPPLREDDREPALRRVLDCGRRLGEPKVAHYLTADRIDYPAPAGG